MNTFDPKKRQVLTYDQFLKAGEKSENAKHIEKGEADLTKKAMSGEKEGKKGIKTLAEGLVNEGANKEFLTNDKDRKIIFHETPAGQYEYAVCDYDDVAGEWDKPRFQALDIDWLDAEEDVMGDDFKKYYEKVKKSSMHKANESEDLFEREFSTEQREKLADKGYAMPDGSFPIASVQDLKNAIKAHGRAKNIADVKKHIKKRAKALGHTELVPDAWK